MGIHPGDSNIHQQQLNVKIVGVLWKWRYHGEIMEKSFGYHLNGFNPVILRQPTHTWQLTEENPNSAGAPVATVVFSFSKSPFLGHATDLIGRDHGWKYTISRKNISTKKCRHHIHISFIIVIIIIIIIIFFFIVIIIT